MEKILLFALDMDGTLLQPDHRTISEEDKAAISAAVQKGAKFIPATGRMANHIPEPVKALPCWEYAITSNGAAVFERETNRIIHGVYLDAVLLRRIVAKLQEFHLFFEIYADGQSFMEAEKLEHFESYQLPAHSIEFFRQKGHQIPSMEDFLAEDHHFEKIYIPYIPKEVYPKLKAMLKTFPVLVTSSVGDNLEVNATDANKGNALRFLQDFLGLKRENLLAVGDQDNDLPMIRYAGVGVAMGNAASFVKEEADFITKTNGENGVAHALNTFIH